MQTKYIVVEWDNNIDSNSEVFLIAINLKMYFTTLCYRWLQ
jgi:hypothetical protein